MTVDATLQTTQLAEFIVQLVNNPMLALQMARDPDGTVAVQGFDASELQGADVNQAILQACGTEGFPPDAATALQSYASGGYTPSTGGYQPPPPHAGPAPADHVVQQLQYVNYVTHEGDTTIQQTILDQSTNIEFGDNFQGQVGDITVDNDNANAIGEGSVAVGEGNAATGEGSQVIDDSSVGQNQNNSDGAVQAGGNVEGAVTGVNSGVLNTGEIDAPVLANSTNTGVIADGDVDDTIVGNNNSQQNPDVEGDVDGVINFGGGADITNVNDSTLTNSAVGDGNATGTQSAVGDGNAIGNAASQGSVVEAGEGNATSNFQDNDESNSINATDSVVTTEQGAGDNDSFDNSFQDNDTFDGGFPPPKRLEEMDEPGLRTADDDEPGAL